MFNYLRRTYYLDNPLVIYVNTHTQTKIFFFAKTFSDSILYIVYFSFIMFYINLIFNSNDMQICSKKCMLLHHNIKCGMSFCFRSKQAKRYFLHATIYKYKYIKMLYIDARLG